jgi:DNA-binding transcriptional LysR family regulator
LDTPNDLGKHPSLFMMRTGVSPIWRLRRVTGRKDEVVVPLTPRLLIDDMVSLKEAAIGGLGVVALPGYVCRDEVQSGAPRRVLPGRTAGDFHADRTNSVPKGSAAVGPRLHRAFSGRIPEGGVHLTASAVRSYGKQPLTARSTESAI